MSNHKKHEESKLKKSIGGLRLKAAPYLVGAFLSSILEKKKALRKQYSLRAFARDLDIAASHLSSVLRGEARLSLPLAEEVGKKLRLSDAEFSEFRQIVKNDEMAARALKRLRNEKSDTFYVISEDMLRVVQDREHWAIFTLLETDGFKHDTKWISTRLGMSQKRVEDCLDRLEETGLVSRDGGKIKSEKQQITTTRDIPVAALREAHRQQIAYAASCLSKVPPELRDISSFFLAFDGRKLHEAKNAIASFRRKFAKKFSTGKRNEVYCLSIQFVPATRPTNSKAKNALSAKKTEET